MYVHLKKMSTSANNLRVLVNSVEYPN